jgi:hypothetical protein
MAKLNVHGGRKVAADFLALLVVKVALSLWVALSRFSVHQFMPQWLQQRIRP